MTKTREEENARRRELARIKREKMKRIRSLTEDARTQEEQEELMLYEERRIKKNIQNRERSMMYSARIEFIEEKPKHQRSPSELEFLEIHMNRRKRKNQRNQSLRLEKKMGAQKKRAGVSEFPQFAKTGFRDWPETVPLEPDPPKEPMHEADGKTMANQSEGNKAIKKLSINILKEDSVLKKDERPV